MRALPLRDGGIQKTDCTSSLFFAGPGLSRDRPAKAAKAGGLTLREGYPCFWALYASPQFLMASRMGFRLYPRSVSVYSTRGGDLRIDRTGQQAAPLHLPELGRQHFSG